jgi:hypothetical protein
MHDIRRFVNILMEMQEYDDQDVNNRRAKMRGAVLAQTDYPHRYVVIYRATVERSFKPMDYITLSRKFATGHADHTAAVEGEACGVIRAMVKTSDVYQAPNTDEYFYDGAKIAGKVIYTANAD